MKAPSVHRFGSLKRFIICKLKETNQCYATDRLVNCFAYHKNITCGIHEICPDRYWKQSLHIQISLNVSHFFLHCPGVQSFSGYCPATVLLYQAYQRWYSSVVNSSCINARVVNLGSFPYRQTLQKNPYLWLDHYILICYLRAVIVRCIISAGTLNKGLALIWENMSLHRNLDITKPLYSPVLLLRLRKHSVVWCFRWQEWRWIETKKLGQLFKVLMLCL